MEQQTSVGLFRIPRTTHSGGRVGPAAVPIAGLIGEAFLEAVSDHKLQKDTHKKLWNHWRRADSDDVQDAINEAVLAAVKYPPKEPVLKPGGWLYVAAQRCLGLMLEKRANEVLCEPKDLAALSDEIQQQETDRTEGTYGLHMDLEKAFGKLSPSDRQLGINYFRDGMTEHELSNLTGVSQSTMHRTIARIETSLRRSLEEHREIL